MAESPLALLRAHARYAPWNARGLASYVTSLVGETPQEEPQRLGIKSMGLAAWADANILAQLAERIDSGKVKIFVNSTFPLEEINTAMAHRLQTTDPGKVIVKIL